jgi:predicted anti-sigma-YlaC factor YlaD
MLCVSDISMLEPRLARRSAPPGAARLAIAALLLLGASSCSIRKYAVNQIGNSIARGGDLFTADDDPELVRDALPFGLKTMEMLLAESPRHEGLLLAATQGFTQYAYAFVQMDADVAGAADYERTTALHDRALRLYLRARRYGLRGLELRHKDIARQLTLKPDEAVRSITKSEQPMLFWTAAAWGSAIGLGKDLPELVADIPVVRALMKRALELDEGYQGGAVLEAMIVLDALPPDLGGSVERAQQDFDRAVAISGGSRPGPYVTLAETIAVQQQDRKRFEALLHQALAIDPEKYPSARLETVMTQRKARALLARADELFIDSGETKPEDSK